MDGFALHNLTHSSPSQINMWAGSADVWVAKYLFGHKFPSNPNMECGKAVEVAVSMMLDGHEKNLAMDAAMDGYNRATAFMGEKAIKKIDEIEPMADMAMAALREAGLSQVIKPSKLDTSSQEEIALTCKGDGWSIPIKGFLDFRFADCIVDLKTSTRLPSVMSVSHQRQRAIYAKATGLPVKFLYATPKKAEFREDGDVATVLADCKAILTRQERFLRVSPCKELLAEIVPPTELDNFYWAGAGDIRREVYKV